MNRIPKVTVIRENARGLACVRFEHLEDAHRCIEAMRGVDIDGRSVGATLVDGNVGLGGLLCVQV